MKLEPIGEFRSELRHGQMMALHLNLNRDSKTEPFKALDMMNFIEKPPEKVYTMEELEAYAAKIFGG